MTERYEGECLCGQVRYRVEGMAPRAFFFCHCSRCRKESGSAHCANLFLSEGALSWLRGQDQVRLFELEGTRKARNFCTNCGCPLPRVNKSGGVVLPAGGLEISPPLKATAHLFCDSQAEWDGQVVEAPRFGGLPG